MHTREKLTNLFNQWLRINSNKFKHKPIHIGENRYRFEDIIENVYLELDEEELSSHIVFEDGAGNSYGYAYLDGIMEVCEDEKGFYDSWKEDRLYFSSYEELIHGGVFRYIVEYCDKYFSQDATLYLADNVCFMSHVICPNNEADSNCVELQRLIEYGTYLGGEKPKETLGVVKIIKYDLFDNSKCEVSYIRDERSTELLFEKWLEKNSDRFTYKPLRKTDEEYYFEGIIKNIVFSVACEECSISFKDENGEYVDHVDIEYIEKMGYKENCGYYDIGTTPYYIEKNLPIPYYETYEELVEKTLFEALVNYCDKKFIKGNYLYLSTSEGGSFATIRSSTEGDKMMGRDDRWKVVKLGVFDLN